MWLFSNSLQNYYIKLPKHVSEIKKMQKKCIFLHFSLVAHYKKKSFPH